jgi:diphosphomevalonate decarboxylase
MPKATVRAPSNIAFIKYWGARDLKRAIPSNPSLSMTLHRCYSRCTVEHVAGDGAHEILWRGHRGGFEAAPPAFADRVRAHLDFLRGWAECGGRFRVATENSFPSAAGLASSASGFAALTLATLAALGREVPVEERSALARRSGSGSAARSVLGGYVEWPFDDDPTVEARCYARQVAPAEHWDLRDVVALVESGPKKVSSLDGHRRARTSPYWRVRQRRLPGRLREVRRAIAERDFERLGRVVETEAVDLHCVAMTSEPPIFYWRPGTLVVLEAVREMRRGGLAAWSTLDAGANVHVICTPESEPHVADRLSQLDEVEEILRDRVGHGPEVEDEHLL